MVGAASDTRSDPIQRAATTIRSSGRAVLALCWSTIRYVIQRQDELLLSFPLSLTEQTVTVQPDGYQSAERRRPSQGLSVRNCSVRSRQPMRNLHNPIVNVILRLQSPFLRYPGRWEAGPICLEGRHYGCGSDCGCRGLAPPQSHDISLPRTRISG